MTQKTDEVMKTPFVGETYDLNEVPVRTAEQPTPLAIVYSVYSSCDITLLSRLVTHGHVRNRKHRSVSFNYILIV